MAVTLNDLKSRLITLKKNIDPTIYQYLLYVIADLQTLAGETQTPVTSGNMEVDGNLLVTGGDLTATDGVTTLSELVLGGESITEISEGTAGAPAAADAKINIIINGTAYELHATLVP